MKTRNRFAHTSITITLGIVMILMTSVLGCVLSTFVAGYISEGGLTRWKPLNFSPGKAVKIVSASLYPADVIVLAADGQNYHYQTKTIKDTFAVNREVIVWERTDLQVFNSHSDDYCNLDLRHMPNPPGQILDSKDVQACFEVGVFYRYVILSDGTVWQWEKPYSLSQYLGLVLAGVSIGLLVGIILAVRITKIRSMPPASHDQPLAVS